MLVPGDVLIPLITCRISLARRVDAELLLMNRRSTPAISSGTILVAIRAMRVTSSVRYSYLFSKVIEVLSSQ